MIPITTVRFGADEEELVLEVLRSGSIAQGPKVAQLETAFAAPGGIAARHRGQQRHDRARRRAPGARPAARRRGDHHAVHLRRHAERDPRGRVPPRVFADIREDDFNVDPAAVAARGDGPRSKVLMPVHLYGQMADMDPLVDIAAAAACASSRTPPRRTAPRYDGTRRRHASGSARFSFYATKNMTTGEGGMITTDDDALADRLRVLRNQGMRAALPVRDGRPQLPAHRPAGRRSASRSSARYDADRRAPEAERARLAAGLAGVAGRDAAARAGRPRPRVAPVHVRVGPRSAVDRDELVARARRARRRQRHLLPEDSSSTTTATATHPRVRDRATCPVAERVARRCLSLPVHPHLTDDELDHDRRRRRAERWERDMRTSTQIALVGAGAWARCTPGSSPSPSRADLAVVVDPREDVGRAVAERFGAALGAGAARPADVDAVVVAAATEAHYELAVAGARGQDRPLLIEKPVADSLLQSRGDPRRSPDARDLPDDVRAAGALQPARSSPRSRCSTTRVHITATRHSPYAAADQAPESRGTCSSTTSTSPCNLIGDAADKRRSRRSASSTPSRCPARRTSPRRARLRRRRGRADLGEPRRPAQVRTLTIHELDRADRGRPAATGRDHLPARVGGSVDDGPSYRQQTIIEIPEIYLRRRSRSPPSSRVSWTSSTGGRTPPPNVASILPSHRVIDHVIARADPRMTAVPPSSSVRGLATRRYSAIRYLSRVVWRSSSTWACSRCSDRSSAGRPGCRQVRLHLSFAFTYTIQRVVHLRIAGPARPCAREVHGPGRLQHPRDGGDRGTYRPDPGRLGGRQSRGHGSHDDLELLRLPLLGLRRPQPRGEIQTMYKGARDRRSRAGVTRKSR